MPVMPALDRETELRQPLARSTTRLTRVTTMEDAVAQAVGGSTQSHIPGRVLVVSPPVTPPGPDVTAELERYRRWLAEADVRRLRAPGPRGALRIALVVLAHTARAAHLCRLVESIVAQPYRDWVLVATVSKADGEATRAALKTAQTRLRLVPVAELAPEPEQVSAGLGEALDTGAHAVMIIGPDDVLGPGALATLALALDLGADVVYADEDRIDDDGSMCDPRMKPDWSPDLLLCTDYVGRPVALTRRILEACGGVRVDAGPVWEYDLLLRASEHARRIDHVSDVLLHRGTLVSRGESPGAGRARATQDALRHTLGRRGEEGRVERGALADVFHVRRQIPGDPLVSVIVPFHDGAPFLRNCVESLLRTTSGNRVEVLLVDNRSTEPETFALIDRLSARPAIRIIEDHRPFNWSAINNAAARQVEGDVLLFLNDDVEARHEGWITAMLEHAMRAEVGAVGARLLYPSGELQHAGVVIGLGGAAGHVLRGLPGDRPGYLAQAVTTRECSAVTGACMMSRRTCFDEMGGFSEDLDLDLNDIDYCLRLAKSGYRTVFTPLAELVHHESPTRGTSGNIASIRSFLGLWEAALRAGDPYLNRHLTRLDCSCSLRRDDEERRWDAWRSILETSPDA